MSRTWKYNVKNDFNTTDLFCYWHNTTNNFSDLLQNAYIWIFFLLHYLAHFSEISFLLWFFLHFPYKIYMTLLVQSSEDTWSENHLKVFFKSFMVRCYLSLKNIKSKIEYKHQQHNKQLSPYYSSATVKLLTHPLKFVRMQRNVIP